MGHMKKADVHRMYREDASAAIESMAIAGSGLEEVIGTAMFAGLAVDIFMCTGEIELSQATPPKAKNPEWQWLVEHRVIIRAVLDNYLVIKNFDLLSFKPLWWLILFMNHFPYWLNSMASIRSPKKDSGITLAYVALPMADRLLMAAYVPSLMYATIKVIANVPRLVGDLLPG